MPARWRRWVGWWRQQAGTVRFRTSAVAVVAVGLVLLVAAIALVVGLRHSLTDYVRSSAALRAQDVADVIEAGGVPRNLAVENDEHAFIQVVDHDGHVVAASRNVRAEPPVASLASGQSTRVRGLAFDDDEFIVVAARADTVDGPLMVLAGRSTDVIGESAGTVTRLLRYGLPALVAIVAVLTWRLAGRALAPVEAIRGEVEGISSEALSRRVPVSPGDDEVARLARTMNAMLARLEDAQVRQRQFVSDASHELRSPVTTIRQYAEVAITHPDGTTPSELAEVVLAESLRLQRLVEDLLWLARGDETVLVTRRRAVDVDDVVLEEVSRLRAMPGVRVDASGLSGGRVMGDRTLLQALVRNLLDNASRHARSTISVSLATDDGDVVLVVEDDGTGVPAEARERVFERFVRLDDARSRDAGGFGLGLAMVAAIASAHAGTVTVGSGVLGGARFEVRAPVAAD